MGSFSQSFGNLLVHPARIGWMERGNIMSSWILDVPFMAARKIALMAWQVLYHICLNPLSWQAVQIYKITIKVKLPD